MDETTIAKEYRKCQQSQRYFINNFCKLEEPKLDTSDWIAFKLWAFQAAVLALLLRFNLITILKARQLGLTWVVVAYCLWMMLFKPGTVVLLVSAGDPEAVALLERLRKMHLHLPEWLQATLGDDNDHTLEFVNLGSRAQAFAPTKKAGRSRTATIVVLDEADWIVWFQQLMAAMKPTIDNGGKLIMLSTPDKERPNSQFKSIWKKAHAGLNNYVAVFLPWDVHPHRDEAWYQKQVDDADSIDDVYQEYPATPAEALSGRSEGKRFKPDWLNLCTDLRPALNDLSVPTVPGLVVYERPSAGRKYVIGADCSEGDVTSDATPATVFDAETWTEVAHIYGIFEPAIQASYLVRTAVYFNNAVICPERNNHGHACILAIRNLLGDMPGEEGQHKPRLYRSPHDKKFGWHSSTKWKPASLDFAADVMREGECKLRTEASILEIGNVEAATLAAPEGDTDDRAMSVFIGLAALQWPTIQKRPSSNRSHSNYAKPMKEGAKNVSRGL